MENPKPRLKSVADSYSRKSAESALQGKPALRHTKMTSEERRQLIAKAAYLRAERRGFAPGSELDDWLAAEVEIDRMIQEGGIKRAARSEVAGRGA